MEVKGTVFLVVLAVILACVAKASTSDGGAGGSGGGLVVGYPMHTGPWSVHADEDDKKAAAQETDQKQVSSVLNGESKTSPTLTVGVGGLNVTYDMETGPWKKNTNTTAPAKEVPARSGQSTFRAGIAVIAIAVSLMLLV